ncbi:MAG: hypothetical protein ACYDDF_14665 [Thermoplasmatota archaeon]
MAAARKESVWSLIVAMVGLLAACVFLFLYLVPGVDAGTLVLIQAAFFVSAMAAVLGLAGYLVLSRWGSSTPSAFDRAIARRRAALGALPAALVAVLIGVLLFAGRAIGGNAASSAIGPIDTTAASSDMLDLMAIGAFLGFGALYVVLMIVLATQAERAAIRAARDDLRGASL